MHFFLFLLGLVSAAYVAEVKRYDPSKLVKVGFSHHNANSKTAFDSTSKGKPYFAVSVNSDKGKPDEVTLQNGQAFYYAEILLGSDKQNVSVLLDTGSSELWVVGKNAECHVETGDCSSYGVFDPSSSSTYNATGDYFEIEYVDQTTSEGPYGTDDLAFAESGPGVTGFKFATATNTSSDVGVLGIGFESGEHTNQSYPNLPALLAKQGVISKNAYSLYLDSDEATSGSIIFGGIDTAKYYDNLIPMPITSNQRLSVKFGGFKTPKGTIPFFEDVILDSGTTFASLPSAVLTQLAQSIGAQFVPSSQTYILPCNQNSTVTFEFIGLKTEIPVSDLIVPLQGDSIVNDGNGQCALAIDPSEVYGGVNLFGDLILRHFYIVYNLEDRVISMAKVKYTSEEHLTTI